jgi:hypothetical protein
MKNWIMIGTMTRVMKGKDNNDNYRIYFCTYFRCRVEVNEWIEFTSGREYLLL